MKIKLFVRVWFESGAYWEKEYVGFNPEIDTDFLYSEFGAIENIQISTELV